MAIEITGILTQVLDVRTGMGKNGEWKNQDFILETPGQYPRQVCISLWGDKTEALKNFAIGDQIKAMVDVESREFNGKWYTNVKAWQVEKIGAPTASYAESPQDLPQAPPPAIGDIPPAEEEYDDLPF
ncbi:DUF3127 domain-containing protein [Bacteroidales bacterium OttesenSCG-928-J16]|nr:DUF3127 domain-containing protein [Bacteroidales bacterium OttesenSCG-928-J16]